VRAVTLFVVLAVPAFVMSACGGSPGAAPPPAPAAPAPPARIQLRYHPRAGDHFAEVLDQRTDLKPDSGAEGMPPTAMVVRTFSHDSVLPSSADTVRIRQVIDSMIPMDTGSGALPGLDRLRNTRGIVGVVSLDDRMVVRNSAFTDRDGNPSSVTAAMGEGARQFSAVLPDLAVAPGDTWSITSTAGLAKMMPGMDSIRISMWFRLDSIVVSGTDTSVRIATRIDFPTAPINIASGNIRLAMFMTGSLTGAKWFSVTRGAVTKDSMAGTVHIAATSPLLPNGLRMIMHQQYIRRVERP